MIISLYIEDVSLKSGHQKRGRIINVGFKLHESPRLPTACIRALAIEKKNACTRRDPLNEFQIEGRI